MIQYEALYEMIIDESARYALGYWNDHACVREDFEELIDNVTKCFYYENKFSSKFSAILIFLQNIEKSKIPVYARVDNLLKVLISILFSEKYESFNSAGALSMDYYDFLDEINFRVGERLKTQTDLTDEELKSIEENDPAILEKLRSKHNDCSPFFFNETLNYLRLYHNTGL